MQSNLTEKFFKMRMIFGTTQFVIFVLFSFATADKTQKDLVEFLVEFGQTLTQSTERFMHEMRNDGFEYLLKELEKIAVEVETLVIQLRHHEWIPEDPIQFKELHGLEEKLLHNMNLATQEIENIKKEVEKVKTTVFGSPVTTIATTGTVTKLLTPKLPLVPTTTVFFGTTLK